MTLKRHTLSSLLWSFGERFVVQIISFVFGVTLARLLAPEDYGIVAMPAVFMAVAGCLVDAGFTSALIRKKDLTADDLNTAFIYSMSCGFICYVVLWSISPYIAIFYGINVLEDVTKFIALNTILSPLCSIHSILLTRNMDFKSLMKISLICSIMSGVIGVFMALNGYGVWALVGQGICGSVIRVVLLWYVVSWRPKLTFSTYSFYSLWNYGNKMMLSSLVNLLSENVYPVLVGKFYSAETLGLFTKGGSIARLLPFQITEVIHRVTYPVLCRLQDDDKSLSDNYRKMLKLTAFVMFPVMICLSVISKTIVVVILGNQWNGAVAFLQLLSIGMMLYPIHAINLNLLQVKGRSDLFLRLEVIKGMLTVVILVLLAQRGEMWLAASVPILSFLSVWINTYYNDNLIKVGIWSQVKDLLPILLVSVLTGAFVYSIDHLFFNVYLRLAMDVPFGIIFYMILSKLFLKCEFEEIMEIIKSFWK